MNPKKLFKAFLLLTFCTVISFMSVSVISQAEEGANEKTSAPDYEAMMELWKEFSTPNENHRVLDAMVGNWDYTIKWWMSPDAEPEVSKGLSSVKWIMGGRFIEHKAEGTSMGQPFEGMGIMGYDNEKKMYTSTWIDNMGTGIVRGSGSYDPATKTMSENGTFSCPAEGEKSYRGVTKFTGKDSFTYEWYLAGTDGKKFRTMEIVYKRKK